MDRKTKKEGDGMKTNWLENRRVVSFFARHTKRRSEVAELKKKDPEMYKFFSDLLQIVAEEAVKESPTPVSVDDEFGAVTITEGDLVDLSFLKSPKTEESDVMEFLRVYSKGPYPDSDLKSYIDSFTNGCKHLIKQIEESE